MGLFPLSLYVTPEPSGLTWEIIHHDFVYVCNDGTMITVPVGFVTDFASIPRAIWVLEPPYGKYSWGAVVHDWLYSTQPFSKERADLIFLEAMESHGVGDFIRHALYEAVKEFGWCAWLNHKRELENQKSKS
jgi:hypothetical protein